MLTGAIPWGARSSRPRGIATGLNRPRSSRNPGAGLASTRVLVRLGGLLAPVPVVPVLDAGRVGPAAGASTGGTDALAVAVVSAVSTTAPATPKRRRRRTLLRAAKAMLVSFRCASVCFLVFAPAAQMDRSRSRRPGQAAVGRLVPRWRAAPTRSPADLGVTASTRRQPNTQAPLLRHRTRLAR